MPPSLPAVDLERLLAPISAEAPAGASLRYEGTYDRIREARREDDASLPQGVWTTKLKVADWGAVSTLACDAIEHRSKDLQIAVWLAEAWTRLGAWRGAAQGVSFVAELLHRYWDDGFPELADGGAEARADLVDWLDETLSRAIRLLPLTPSGDGPRPYRLLDWEAPGAPEHRVTDDADGASTEATPTRESFLARASILGKDIWIDLRKDTKSALAAAERLEAVLADKAPHPPLLRRFKEALRATLRIIEAIPSVPAEDEGDQGAPGEAPGGEASGGEALDDERDAGAGRARARGGPIKSRAEAYLRLSEAADYLLRTEPHSPVPYLVKRAVSWGNMSLTELLYEFVSSPDDLLTIQRLLGMRGRE